MMQHITAFRSVQRFLLFMLLAGSAVAGLPVRAQATSASRIVGPIDATSHISLHGTVSPRIKGALDEGRVAGNLKMNGLTLILAPTPAQQADLKQLLVDQQTPGSSSYHVWLTPAQYAARFGVSDADMAKVESWLTTEGFTVSGANNSRTRITFSGTAGQVESTFSTELHHYNVNGESHLANATELQVPSALSGLAAGVANITDFRPKPRVRRPAVAPRYTSSQSGSIFVTPADLNVVYDIAPLYAAGYTGTGQRIAVAGQSEILLSDIASFRTAAGLSANAPTTVLVPGTGASAISSGDETESDIDLEYSGAIATNAQIYFVYVGSDQNYDVFDALTYAVDTDLAPVISVSYGTCEANLDPGEFSSMETVFEQANSQGQTIFSAAGDSGATDCDDSSSTTNPIISATHGLAVDYPAASQYVTGVGGTMFNDASSTSTYWAATNTADGGSALSYVPEEVWNETTASIAEGGGLTGGGGGASTLTTKPTWQTGTGVPADGHRDVPDISLDAAAIHEPYLYCSSDTATGITGSCTNGFRDANSTYLTVAGGTSFGAPIAAGLMTLVNQKSNSSGQGNVNPTLYALAASTPSAFHDITVGNNSQPCTSGSTGCTTSPIGFSAGVGYDQASGLGTVDATVLAGGFTVTAPPALIATTITLSPSGTTVTAGTATTITATIAGASGTGTPTGTVQFVVDGVSAGAAVPLTGAVATYALSTTTLAATGSHVITATYSGDTVYATSYAVDTITVTAAASNGVGTFTLAGTTATAALGGTGTSTITVTPASGYTGSVAFTLATSSTVLNNDSCYDINNASVTSATTPVAVTLTFYTSQSACNGTVSPSGRVLHRFSGSAMKSVAANDRGGQKPGFPALPVSAAAVAGALCLLGARRRSRLWMVMAVVLLSGAALGSIGCGGSSGTPITTTTQVPAGSYTVSVTGTDTTYSSITATTNITLTVQ